MGFMAGRSLSAGRCLHWSPPVLAYFAWMTKKRGVFPKNIAAGIVAVSVMSSILLFDHLRVHDVIIDGVLIYILFFKKKDADKRKQDEQSDF